MDKYRRVEKVKTEDSINETEIRVTTQGKTRNYISYATSLFQTESGEPKTNQITLKAMGRAINKTVTIAEILKRRVPGLHQITVIDSTDIVDVWEPLEEGLDRIESVRHVSALSIFLANHPLDTAHPGYQAPIPDDQVKTFGPIGTGAPRGVPRGRGRGRVIRGRGFSRGRGRGAPRFTPPAQPEKEVEEATVPEVATTTNTDETTSAPRGRGASRARGRGRGRGRGFRGRGRGFRGNRGGTAPVTGSPTQQ